MQPQVYRSAPCHRSGPDRYAGLMQAQQQPLEGRPGAPGGRSRGAGSGFGAGAQVVALFLFLGIRGFYKRVQS